MGICKSKKEFEDVVNSNNDNSKVTPVNGITPLPNISKNSQNQKTDANSEQNIVEAINETGKKMEQKNKQINEEILKPLVLDTKSNKTNQEINETPEFIIKESNNVQERNKVPNQKYELPLDGVKNKPNYDNNQQADLTKSSRENKGEVKETGECTSNRELENLEFSDKKLVEIGSSKYSFQKERSPKTLEKSRENEVTKNEVTDMEINQ